MIAGYSNATSNTDTITSPVPGGSMSTLPLSTGSSTIHNTSIFSSSNSTLEKPHVVSIVTVTDRTTVTETSCSDSWTPLKSLESASALPTSLVTGNIVKSKTSMMPSVSTSALIPVVNTPAIAALLSDRQTSQSAVIIITKTAWTTTWTSITAQPAVPISSSAKQSHSSAHKDPQQPIDQASAKPMSPPMTTAALPQTPVLTEPTTLCTSNGTVSLGLAGKTSTSIEVSISRPTVHTGLPIFGTAGTRLPKVTQSLHPLPKIPIIPNLPFGHPPSLSNHTIVRNHTTLSFYHEKPTIYLGTASSSKHHVSASSTIHPAAKCTTTFLHSPTQPCTGTVYAHTKTITVDCYGCVGEQAQATKETHHEGKVRISSIPKRFAHNITNRFQQICNNSTAATVTLPVSKKSVCAGLMVATGGSVVSKGKPSTTHVGSNGFATSTSAAVHGSGYGHGNWTGIA